VSFPLNPEQLEATKWRSGPVVIQACPGAGKTRTLVELVNGLLEEGYPADKIVAMTFTREAAEEMASRAGLSEEQRIFRTFHSFCLDLIHKESRFLPFQLTAAPPEAGQQRKLLGSICRANRIDFKQLTGFISSMKRKGVTPEKALEDALGAVGLRIAVGYQQYDKQCRELGWVDFDSMLIESVNLLAENEEVRNRWQFKFVLVDEAQDTDNVQWRLVDLISKEHGNVFAVGDEEQLIYAWRGAVPDGLSNFAQKFSGARTILLFRNYRSTPEIVAFSKKFAPKKSELIDRMVSQRASGVVPCIRRFAGEGDEATKILSSILDPEHTAILTRTNRQLSKFENACIDRGIKYNLLKKSGFWTQPEVKYMLAYLQASQYPTDAAVKTIIQSPFRETKYIKDKRGLISALDDRIKRDKFVGENSTPMIKLLTDPEIVGSVQATQESLHKVRSLIGSLKNLGNGAPTEVMQRILDTCDVKVYYEVEEEGDGDNDAIDNINELYKIVSRFQTVNEALDFARKAIAASRRSKKPRLTLSTVHQAKGKEWAHVFVTGVCKDILPHKRGEASEEKRIMWVAVTRAADTLTVSFYGTPSEYIEKLWTPEAQKAYEEAAGVQGFKGQPTLFEGLA
jgi:DNA helicase II / ATP-dependent DNA helicase PcrA